MSYVTTGDGTEIFYKEWGAGPPVVFSHGWPLNSDSWEAQMLFRAFSETDFRGDLRAFDVPTLVVHGDDQVVPFDVGGKASASIASGARLEVYAGAPHGNTDTHRECLSVDLRDFARS